MRDFLRSLTPYQTLWDDHETTRIERGGSMFRMRCWKLSYIEREDNGVSR